MVQYHELLWSGIFLCAENGILQGMYVEMYCRFPYDKIFDTELLTYQYI